MKNRLDPASGYPYPSRRMPVLARNAVASSQPLAVQAGVHALAVGGNALDAALATAITLAVVEPCSNGLGSDLFCLLWDGSRLHGLNASGHSPSAWSPARFAGQEQMPRTGWDAVTIPGAVAGWVTLSRRFGRLPFADLFERAIRYARDGYPVSPVVADKWAKAVTQLADVPGWAEHFLPFGRAPLPGETFRCAPMARSLELIAATDGDAFYRGELASRMVAHSQSLGGAHTLEDFAGHGSEWVSPISIDYRGHTVHEIPPNGQGIAALVALGIAGNFDIAALANDSVEKEHLLIESMKLAFADVHRYVADPHAMAVTPDDMLDPTYLAARARQIDPRRAQSFGAGRLPAGGTVYLATADEAGMMVSLIQSNYIGFGSGVVVPGTGISLQNRGAGFVLIPGHPNEVGPCKRPFHTIIPGFVTQGGMPVCSFGVMGGPIQPQGHLQTLVRMIDYGQNPQSALDAPRWKVNGPSSIDLEPSAPSALSDGLTALGHRLETGGDAYSDFGAGQIVCRIDGGYVCGSDPRRDGQAAGF